MTSFLAARSSRVLLQRAGGMCFCGTAACLNFFPLGLKSGPKNISVNFPINNFDGAINNMVAPLPSENNTIKRPGYVLRHELKLNCECCRFEWLYDTLTVRCSAYPALHNQQEIWLQPTWMYHRQQPHKWYRYMNLSKNPRTHQLWSREDSKGMNCERRTMGLTSYTMRMAKETRGIARSVSNIGTYGTRWQTRFPFPT